MRTFSSIVVPFVAYVSRFLHDGYERQAAEAYILMRGCLEAAMYALHIEINPDLRMIWLNRDKDPESRNACINRFQQRKVAKTLQDKSKWLSEIATQLYEHTIDLGAHPNKRSATDCLEIDTDVENKTLTMRYEVGRPDQITDAWEATCHVGACALHIMQLARPDYFKRLEIDAMLDRDNERTVEEVVELRPLQRADLK